MQAYIAKIEHLTDEHWAGNLSTAVFFAGCDFNCPNCNTPEMLGAKEEFLMDLKDVKKTIKEQVGTIKAVVFTGGEPCLQRQPLLSLASFAKDAGLRTGLITNGSKTECIRSLLNLNLIDCITLDIKSPLEEGFFERATRSRTFFKTTMELIDDIKSTIRLLKENQDKIEVIIRTTVTPTLVSRKEDLLRIADMVEDIECVWELKRFSPDNVSNRKFSSIKPPSRDFLENLRETVQKRYPRIRIMLD